MLINMYRCVLSSKCNPLQVRCCIMSICKPASFFSHQNDQTRHISTQQPQSYYLACQRCRTWSFNGKLKSKTSNVSLSHWWLKPAEVDMAPYTPIRSWVLHIPVGGGERKPSFSAYAGPEHHIRRRSCFKTLSKTSFSTSGTSHIATFCHKPPSPRRQTVLVWKHCKNHQFQPPQAQNIANRGVLSQSARLPHTPSNSHFVRKVKLRLAYRLAFVIYS